MTTTTPAATPAQLYLASLSEGSQGMRQTLDIIAGILDDAHDADTFPWQAVTYRESMAVRIALMERYKPSTVNKMLSALRGVLKQTWRLGLIDADAYRRAADVENIRVSDLLSGRTLASDELAELFGTCAADSTAKGTRDAAMLAVFYGCGLRRGELAGLDLDDFDPEDGSIVVNGKRRKQRAVYLSEDGCRYFEAWIRHRGHEPGPLFCPVGQTGEVRVSRMRGESIAYILRRRQEEAGTSPFSPHDLRSNAESRIMRSTLALIPVTC